MKITFTLPHASLAGGIRVVAIYADRLHQRGHDVLVVSTPRRQMPFKSKLKSLLTGDGWPADAAPGPSHFEGLEVPHNVIERFRPVTDSDLPDADVVIATWWRTAPWVAQVSPRKGAKAFFIQGYEVPPGERNPDMDAAWQLPLHKIVISGWLRDLAATRFGDRDVSQVPNSVDTTQFHAPRRGLAPAPTVGVLYAPSALKGMDVALKAVALARDSLPRLKLVAFGASQQREEFRLPPETEFHLQPPQDRIRDIYAKCDVWLCGSRSEGFGLPILEAMACRTPVVSTPVGAAPELLGSGGGILVAPEDPTGMANAIVRIFEMSEQRWRAMSDAAYATATRYTWDDATDLFEQALQTAIDRSQSRRPLHAES